MFYIDQIGHRLELHQIPQRIVSLVPSQTEWLFELGLAKQIVGITKFCIHPADLCQKTPKIGGTKDFKIPKIKTLEPDLVIGNKEENTEEGIKELQTLFPVWTSDIIDWASALDMMRQTAYLTGKAKEGEQIVQQIENQVDQLSTFPPRSALYLIWHKPMMAAGTHTFIDAMLAKAGFQNVVKTPRYPELSAEQIAEFAPELILLSSEPYPFSAKHQAEIQAISPRSKVIFVDGELFSWYGSRLQYFPDYARQVRALLNKNF